jgi:hypothetical protein
MLQRQRDIYLELRPDITFHEIVSTPAYFLVDAATLLKFRVDSEIRSQLIQLQAGGKGILGGEGGGGTREQKTSGVGAGAATRTNNISGPAYQGGRGKEKQEEENDSELKGGGAKSGQSTTSATKPDETETGRPELSDEEDEGDEHEVKSGNPRIRVSVRDEACHVLIHTLCLVGVIELPHPNPF